MFDHPELDPYDRSMLFAVADHANPAGEACPSVATLMVKSGIASRDTIYKRLKKFERTGILKILPGRSYFGTNRYVLLGPMEVGDPAMGEEGEPSCPPDGREVPITSSSRYRRFTDNTTGTSSPSDVHPGRGDFWADIEREAAGDPSRKATIAVWRSLSERMGFHLADGLIERGLKNERYRNDATCDAWQWILSGLAACSMHPDEHELRQELLDEAVAVALESLSFRGASEVDPPPKILERHWDTVLGEARCRVIPDPEPTHTELPPPSKAESEEARRLVEEYERRYVRRDARGGVRIRPEPKDEWSSN